MNPAARRESRATCCRTLGSIHEEYDVLGKRCQQDESEQHGNRWSQPEEEILYREARKLGLDEDDTIIRRRLAQKLTFLNEDLANAVEPSEAELVAFFGERVADYTEPLRFSFEHRYFSGDRRKDAEGDARAAMVSSDAPGDPFILQKSYVERSEREIADLFGRDFSEHLAGLDAAISDQWQGPVPSAYGWHLVRVSQRLESREPLLSDVLDAVRRDYLQQRRRDANETFYESLKSRYDIQLMAPAQ